MSGLPRRSVLLASLPAVSAVVFPGAASVQKTLSIAGLDVTVWRPAGAGKVALPIVVFSHGFHGCATQSGFLLNAFAAAGYLVVAPNHADASCGGGHANATDPPEHAFDQPALWDEATYRGRGDDIRRLIDALRTDPSLKAHIDWARLGLAGYSLGGYTMLGLAGGCPGWRLGGVKAVLALAPYLQPFLVRRTLGGLVAPVMYQGGTLDTDINPWLGKPMGAYESSPSPKYYVEMQGASHIAWTDMQQVDHAAITRYGVAFMNRYVLGRGGSRVLTRRSAGVARLRGAAGS
jgi:predicted dienelactone hydrolase